MSQTVSTPRLVALHATGIYDGDTAALTEELRAFLAARGLTLVTPCWAPDPDTITAELFERGFGDDPMPVEVIDINPEDAPSGWDL